MRKTLVTIVIIVAVGVIGAFKYLHPGGVSVTPNTTQNLSAGQSSSSTSSTGSAPTSSQSYKDGTYTGASADAYYGNVQVQVMVSGGKISTVSFLDYPQHAGTSRAINSQAIPYLKQEAIQAQSAQVDGVSGASYTSQAFEQSLQSALSQAT